MFSKGHLGAKEVLPIILYISINLFIVFRY